ncbi:hypothetical protein JXI42_09595 [bacterium]|nr:hypothetical protein [bacterium]
MKKCCLAVIVLLGCIICNLPVEAQVNGEIIEQDLDVSRYGYTIIKLWGSHYDMGYAYGYLMGEDIATAIEEAKLLVASWGYSWSEMITLVNSYTYKPDCIEDEFDGLADGVNDTVTGASYTAPDVKAINLFGDIAYAISCRSVSSWGSTVSNSEFSTISTRRLDYYDVGIEAQYHHVVAKFEPDDGSPKWVNFAWPGYVACVTGVNEFGTIASLHDWGSMGSSSPNPLPRVIAARYALTMVTDSDISTHLDSVFAELNTYGAATPGFLNYYVPNGGGGVIKHTCEAGYYEVRYPQPGCYGGEAIYTNNSDISGATIGEPWGTYYADNAPTGDITMDGQWTTAGPSFHRVTVGVRGRDDMVIWFDGYTPTGLTPKLELEWNALEVEQPGTFNIPEYYEIHAYPNPFSEKTIISYQLTVNNGQSNTRLSPPTTDYRLPVATHIYDINGRLVYTPKEGLDDPCSLNPASCQPFETSAKNGYLSFSWTPEPTINSGIYFIRSNMANQNVCKKIIYLK